MTPEQVQNAPEANTTRGWKSFLTNNRLLRFVFISLLTAQATPSTVCAQTNAVPPLSGVDFAMARHRQTLLATHFNGQPLTVDHGAPRRLLVPVKLGLKNAKAITRITYSAEEPGDYWAERKYSRYEGI